MLKNYKSLLISFFLILILFGCSDKKEEKKVVTFWAMGSEGENLAPFLLEFESENKDISINLQSIPWSSAHDKLLTAYAGGSTPDMCQLGNTWVPELYAMNALVNLDSFLLKSKIVSREKYFDGIWETNIINNSLFGIPWYVETRALFYRSDLLLQEGIKNPPQTWDEFLDVAKALTKDTNGDGITDQYGIFLPINPNLEPTEVYFIFQNDGEILRYNDLYSNLESQEVIEALNFYLEFFKKGYSPIEQNRITNLYQAFQSGFIGMFINGPWNINQIRTRFPDFEEKWSVAPLPMKKNRNSNAGGSSLVIFKNCKNLDAAWKLIEFLSQVRIQREFYKATSDLPSVKQAWEDSVLLNDPKIKAFYTQLQSAKPFPKIPEWEQIANKMGQWVEMAIFNKLTLEQAVKNMTSDVDRILEKRRWLYEKK
jgi:multiple sugar transport system substrate-binding protein